MPVDCEWTINCVHPPSLACWFVCGFEGLGIWSSLQRTCSHFKHETDLSGEKLTAWNDVTCNQYATEPVAHNTVVCDFHDAVFIWNHTQVCPPSHHILNCILVFVQDIFALLCFPKIFPLPLSPLLHLLISGDFLSFLFLFLPSFSLLSPSLCCVHHPRPLPQVFNPSLQNRVLWCN